MLRKTILAGATVSVVLTLPAAAQAHVSFHPNAVPQGAFATLTLRVPSEQENADTTKIAIQLPSGFSDVTADPPAGWSYTTKTRKLATPIKTDEGEIDTEITEIDFTGGRIPPEQFAQFPLSVVIPGKAGDVLTFKTVQTYSNGKVSRWIGPPSSESPAPTIDVTAAGGPLQDIAGGEAGPPVTVPAASTTAKTAKTTTVTVQQGSSGASKGLGIAALVIAIIALILGGVALLRRRPAAE